MSPPTLPPVEQITRLAVSQWDRDTTPIFRRLVDNLVGVRGRVIEEPLAEIHLQHNINDAYGAGLDWIGERLGLARPPLLVPIQVFGFRPEDAGFDQAPFADADVDLSIRQPVGDDYYRDLLRARAVQVTSRGTIPDLKRQTDMIFELGSRWSNIPGVTGAVAFEACGSRYQMYQLAKAAGLLEPPAGVRREARFGPWALVSGRSEVIRVFVAAGAGTIYDRSAAAGALTPEDQVIDQDNGNPLAAIEWDAGTELLTLTAATDQGPNTMPAWLMVRSSLEAVAMNAAGVVERSITFTAPTADSIAVDFSSSAIFPLAAGDRVLIVIADSGTVDETGDPLYVPRTATLPGPFDDSFSDAFE